MLLRLGRLVLDGRGRPRNLLLDLRAFPELPSPRLELVVAASAGTAAENVAHGQPGPENYGFHDRAPVGSGWDKRSILSSTVQPPHDRPGTGGVILQDYRPAAEDQPGEPCAGPCRSVAWRVLVRRAAAARSSGPLHS